MTFHLCHFTFRPVPLNVRDRVRPDFQAPGGTLPSIKEVSNACGYASQNFFCRQFKDRFHVSPSDYVRQNVAL